MNIFGNAYRLSSQVGEPVTCVQFSDSWSASVVALGHTNGVVQVFDSNTGQLLHRYHKHKHKITSLAIDINNIHLVAATEKGYINVYDLKNKRRSSIRQWHTDTPVLGMHVCISSFYTASENAYKSYNIKDGYHYEVCDKKELALGNLLKMECNLASILTANKANPDDAFYYVSGAYDSPNIVQYTFSEKPIVALAMSAKQRSYVAAASEQQVVIYDRVENSRHALIKHNGTPIIDIAITEHYVDQNRKPQYLFVLTAETLDVWSLKKLKCIESIERPAAIHGRFVTLSQSFLGERLVIGSDCGNGLVVPINN